jgi:uncharacterized membrane protein
VAPGLKQRIESFDWLRGVAVLFMIQCHTVMFLLDPSLKGSTLYRTLLKLDGLVAPSFIFAAGFSLALVQVRSASKGSRAQRVRRTLRRLFEVLAVATLVNWMWFPVFREPKWLLRLDILHCIGLSLLIALPLLSGLATRPKVLRWVTLALSIAVFAITPLFEKTTGWPSLFLNPSSGALFPLLPWAGYVYLGASAGATAALGELRALVLWIGLLLLLGLVCWLTLGLDHPQRVVWVMTFVLGFLFLENRLPKVTTTLPFRVATVFGTSSLAAYFLHEAMLFCGTWWAFALGLLGAYAWLQRRAEPDMRPAFAALALAPLVAYQATWRVRGVAMADFFRDKADWPTYAVLLAVMLAATYGLVLVTDQVYRQGDAWFARRRP